MSLLTLNFEGDRAVLPLIVLAKGPQFCVEGDTREFASVDSFANPIRRKRSIFAMEFFMTNQAIARRALKARSIELAYKPSRFPQGSLAATERLVHPVDPDLVAHMSREETGITAAAATPDGEERITESARQWCVHF